jgi:hypothetical protein
MNAQRLKTSTQLQRCCTLGMWSDSQPVGEFDAPELQSLPTAVG